MTAAARPAATAARKLAVAVLLVAAVIGIHTRPLASAAAVTAASAIAIAAAPASRLPAEFSAIRPADLDGSVPPIPPSEMWPAQ